METEKFISKSDLQVGAYYIGECRNSNIALWNGKQFLYIREKFGSHFLEDINHPQDDNGYDLFYPYKVVLTKDKK